MRIEKKTRTTNCKRTSINYLLTMVLQKVGSFCYVENPQSRKVPGRKSRGIRKISRKVFFIEVRDSPHGIFGSCTWYPRGLTIWAELLGRHRRRRRHLEIQVDIQARELYLEFVPMDLDSDGTSRDIDTAVLHRISIRI